MSGPKYSTAIIREIERLQQLAKQLEEELELQKRTQIISEIEHINREKEKTLSDHCFVDCDALIVKAEAIVPDSKYLDKLKKIREEISNVYRTTCSTDGNSEKMLKNLAEYKSVLSVAQGKKALISDLIHHISEEATRHQQEEREASFLNEKWEDTGKKISTFPEDIKDIYIEILEMVAANGGYEENKEAIDIIINNPNTDWAYKRHQLLSRRDAIKVENNRSVDIIDVLRKTTELRSIYRLLGCEKEIPKDTAAIDAAMEDAKRLLKEKQQTEYIASCVNKVFKERGYNLLDDAIVINKGGTIRNNVYDYGDDSLISVSMSNKGQMLFEVVGDGTQKSMDATRAAQLESEMRRFCPDYSEIRDALIRDYGIALEQEHLCEADRKYAKAIDVVSNTDTRRKKKEKKSMSYD